MIKKTLFVVRLAAKDHVATVTACYYDASVRVITVMNESLNGVFPVKRGDIDTIQSSQLKSVDKS
jgi:hypothetical protein